MTQTGFSRRRRIRRRFAFGGIGLAAVVALLAALALPATAGNGTIWKGQGTDENGACSNVSGSGSQQVWHFVLTNPGPGPWTLTADFTNSGTKTDQGEQQGGGAVFFFVTTSAGDTLESASATGGTDKSVLTVSDCELTGPPETTPETTPETAPKAPPPPPPGAPVAVVAAATFTG